jgi:hypothetical protein
MPILWMHIIISDQKRLQKSQKNEKNLLFKMGSQNLEVNPAFPAQRGRLIIVFAVWLDPQNMRQLRKNLRCLNPSLENKDFYP